MSVAFERERYLREVRFSVASMFVLVVVYGVIVTWVWAPRAVTHPDPAKLLTMEGFLAALAAACLAGGLYAWHATPTKRMLDLAARKLGKAEREPGWPPRAIALKTRLVTVATILEGPAMVGVVARAFGAPAWEALCYIGASALAVGWMWLALPRKVVQVMG